MPEILKLRPSIKARPWGGHKLKQIFGVQKPEPIGEYWVVSAHPKGHSVVVNGKYAGSTLHELALRYPDWYLGNSPQPRFPLLIKFLEAAEHLSVQVHPDDEYALAVEGDYGKTECWYILDAKRGAAMIYGHTFKDRQDFLGRAQSGSLKDGFVHVPIFTGQTVYIPAGTLHALLAPVILLEVQQSSDITYRVYDWGRVDQSGQPRKLHLHKAAEVLSYAKTAMPLVQATTLHHCPKIKYSQLITCKYFKIEKLELSQAAFSIPSSQTSPLVLVLIKGACTIANPDGQLGAQAPDALLLPIGKKPYDIIASAECELLKISY